MPTTAAPSPDPASRPTQDWRILVAVFWVTSMVEGLGVSQIFALLPTYLREMGVPEADRLAFIGIFSALIFVVGMPLVPLWGAWADKYSRKVVIVRSALVEAVVFAGGRPRARTVAARPGDAAHRVPARQHRDHARGDPRRDAPSSPGDDDRDLRGVRRDRLRGRAGAGGHPHRRVRLVDRGGLRVLGAPVRRDGAARHIRLEGSQAGGRADRPDRRSRVLLAARRPHRPERRGASS